jgi:uncharacterized protein (TIGR02466 family)
MTDAITTAPVPKTLKVAARMEGLFSTPVVVGKVEEPQGLIAEIKERVLARQAAHPGQKRSNVNGWHSTPDMLDWGGNAARRVARASIDLAKKMSRFTDGTADDYDFDVTMWANVSGPGAYNQPHTHAGILWAAVFYVDAGMEGADGDVGGRIYFEDPRHPLPTMRLGSFRMAGADGKPQDYQSSIRPAAGDLILFPAWLKHGVEPYSGTSQRISLAMNIDVANRVAKPRAVPPQTSPTPGA